MNVKCVLSANERANLCVCKRMRTNENAQMRAAISRYGKLALYRECSRSRGSLSTSWVTIDFASCHFSRTNWTSCSTARHKIIRTYLLIYTHIHTYSYTHTHTFFFPYKELLPRALHKDKEERTKTGIFISLLGAISAKASVIRELTRRRHAFS